MNKLQLHGFDVSDAYEPSLSGHASSIFDKWLMAIVDIADGFSAQETTIPACIAESTLVTADYTDHFPHHVMDCADNVDKKATPATCLHVYQQLADTQLSEAENFHFGKTLCRRKESEEWRAPFVLSAFTMAEIVVLGGKEEVKEARQSFKQTAESLFEDRGLPVELDAATDAFFLGEDSGARYMQKLKELKHEFLVEVDGMPVPIASVNLHEDYFGRRFNIGDRNGNPCWSACLAFGLERIVACKILQNE